MTKDAEKLVAEIIKHDVLHGQVCLAQMTGRISDAFTEQRAQARREALNQTEKALLKARGVLPSRREALSFINMNEIICALDCIEDALALIPQDKACKEGER